MFLNVGCGEFSAPSPWVNVDVVRIPQVIEPDVVLRDSRPRTLIRHFGKRSVTRLYLGHVLEHLYWEDAHDYLRQLRPIFKSGAQILAVGPDVLLAIQRFASGTDPFEEVMWVLEADISFQPQSDTLAEWDEARHKWNCHGDRLERLFRRAGFSTARQVPIDEVLAREWPLTSLVQRQCAVLVQT